MQYIRQFIASNLPLVQWQWEDGNAMSTMCRAVVTNFTKADGLQPELMNTASRNCPGGVHVSHWAKELTEAHGVPLGAVHLYNAQDMFKSYADTRLDEVTYLVCRLVRRPRTKLFSGASRECSTTLSPFAT